jgi:iron complex transport system permease protein
MNPEHRPAARLKWILLLAGLGGLLAVSLFIGRYPAPYWMPPSLLGEDDLARRLVLLLRLPRIAAALLMGASLSASGLVLQMVFRNPLVEPGFLGVSQGAAFGAAFSILLVSASPVAVELFAALFALFGLALSYTLARQIRYGGWILRLILAGIAVSAIFAAGIGLLKYLADPLAQLPEITFWMLGGLWGVTGRELIFLLPLALPGLLMMFLMRWRLNLLTLSDETAISLGSQPGRERMILLLAAVIATAAVTAVGGIVGWVGLIVPHLARRQFGVSAEQSLPAAMVIGGGFLVICDTLARTLLAGEIPLGILASFLGASIFIGLMLHGSLRPRP